MEPYPESATKQTCKQCRLRKVRCDGKHDVCGHCSRLDYVCSFSQPDDVTPSGDGDDRSLALPRRRTGIACRHCRDHKIKCSGQLPQCHNCIRRGLLCDYPAAKRRIRSPQESAEGSYALDLGEETHQLARLQQDQSSVDGSSSHSPLAAVPVHGSLPLQAAARHAGPASVGQLCACYPSVAGDQYMNSGGSLPSLARLSGSNFTQNLLGRIDAFFAYVYPLPSYSFLHSATIKTRCASGNLDRALSLATYGAILLHSNRQSPDPAWGVPGCACRGIPWIEASESIVWESIERPTVSSLQALLLAINHRMETGHFQRAFMLAALAARFAVAMRLNHERGDLGLISQEVRRRLMWNLKLTERYFSIGLPEFELCPFEIICLQLPRQEEDFGVDQPGDGKSYSLCIGLEPVRRDVMKTNRDLALYSQPFPGLTGLLRKFESKLADIATQMPDGPDFFFSNIAKVLESPWLPRHVFMHLSWHQCHCDMYRLLLPGFQEAAPKPVLSALDATELANAETQCLRHASAIIDVLTTLNEQSAKPLRLEFDSVICAYQACRLLLFLSRFGKAHERPTPESATSRVALCLVALNRFFPSSALAQPVIDEIKRTLEVFISSSPHQDATVTLTPQELTGLEGESHDSLASRAHKRVSTQTGREKLAIHSLLRRADFSGGDEGDEGIAMAEATVNRPVATHLVTSPAVPGFSAAFGRQELHGSQKGKLPEVAHAMPSLNQNSTLRLPIESWPGTVEDSASAFSLALTTGNHGTRSSIVTDDWELDSFSQLGDDTPLFPWYGRQDQNWFTGN